MSFIDDNDWKSKQITRTEIDERGVTRVHLQKDRRSSRSKVVSYNTWIEQGIGEDDSDSNSLLYIQEQYLPSVIKALQEALEEIAKDRG